MSYRIDTLIVLVSLICLLLEVDSKLAFLALVRPIKLLRYHASPPPLSLSLSLPLPPLSLFSLSDSSSLSPSLPPSLSPCLHDTKIHIFSHVLQALETETQVQRHHVHYRLSGPKDADSCSLPWDSILLLCHYWR